jgi:hypothetical protein
MNNENQKIARIGNVLLDYFLSLSAKDVSLSIHEEGQKIYITIQAQEITISKLELDFLKNYLYMERQEEMEEYYWHLVGNDSESEELSLVGMMVDEATVRQTAGGLIINLVRYI